MDKEKRRPLLISIICIIGFIWIVFTFPGVCSPFMKKIGNWVPALYGFIIACSFISYVGVWHMKKWGVHLYIITICIKESFFFTADLFDLWTMIGIGASILFTGLFAGYYKRMSVNL